MLNFTKYHGAGNDFILIEDFDRSFSSTCIAQLCHRSYGIGADGLILLQHSTVGDFRMRSFNADGSEVSMCGNGLRCLVQFLVDLGKTQEDYRIETEVGVLTVNRHKGKIFTHFGIPEPFFWERSFSWEGKEFTGYGVHIGVPHIIFFEPINHFLSLAKHLRSQENANINLAEVLSLGELSLRTYERGVEAETLACGTGAAAAAYVTKRLFNWEDLIRVKPQSGDWLEVDLTEGARVTGPVKRVFHGSIC